MPEIDAETPAPQAVLEVVPAPEPAHVPDPPPELPLIANRYYDEPTCRVFAEELDEDRRARAGVLFAILAERGSVTSVELAHELDMSVTGLPGALITPLRRRADAMDLPLPFESGVDEDSRLRRWSDSGGIAARMLRALDALSAED